MLFVLFCFTYVLKYVLLVIAKSPQWGPGHIKAENKNAPDRFWYIAVVTEAVSDNIQTSYVIN